jgi:group II intron reverse transcriptase/maturase
VTTAPTVNELSPKLLRVAELARCDPKLRFKTLAHLIDEAALRRAFARIRKDASPGVDGITKEQYGEHLEENLQKLLARMKAKQYRHQPILRVHIPKEQGRTRPIGIPAVEDKVVQRAIGEVLEAIYEQDFLDCSYGFRPGRRAHDALRELDRAGKQGVMNWVLEADIMSYFDSIDRELLAEMLQRRIEDRDLLRLIGKCLHVGVMEGEEYSEPERGTAQGSGLSPLLGNIYLHHVLDEWFEREVRPRLEGKARLVRFADDLVIGFERREDAERVLEVIGKRMGRFGLKLHPDKTRLICFERPRPGQKGGKGPGTFDFLGFTLFWRRGRRGAWNLGFKTRKGRLRRALGAIAEWCRRHRHDPVREQHAALCRRLNGHINYFGVSGNTRSTGALVRWTERAWRNWLGRRSQRARMSWARFKLLLKRYPLPRPTVRVHIWVATR